MMKLQRILAKFCLLLVNIPLVNGFPVQLGDNEKQIQRHHKYSREDRKKQRDSKVEITVEEWKKIVKYIDPGKLQVFDKNHYGFTGAPDDIPSAILQKIIEKHLIKLRDKTSKHSLKPPRAKKSDKKWPKPTMKENTNISQINYKNDKNKKQNQIELTTKSPSVIERNGHENVAISRQTDVFSETTDAVTKNDEGVTDDIKLIEIVAYPTGYTKSLSSTLTLPSSSTLSLSSRSLSLQSISSLSTITIPSSSSSSSSVLSSSVSSLTSVTSSKTLVIPLSSSKLSSTTSSSTASSSTFFQTSSRSPSISSSFSSTSPIFGKSFSLFLWSVMSSLTSSSTIPTTSSVSSTSTTSLLSSSSSSSSASLSSSVSQSSLPVPLNHVLRLHILHNDSDIKTNKR